MVQLASDSSAEGFQSHVAQLRQRGLVPGDAKATTTADACGLFGSQINTYVLYSGPFANPAGGCPDRLSGPYDALIRTTSAGFFSCVCSTNAQSIPPEGPGQSGQWVGELQRMLSHVGYSVGALDTASWGAFTAGTQDAVRRFQTDAHLPASGQVDGPTWSKLQAAGC